MRPVFRRSTLTLAAACALALAALPSPPAARAEISTKGATGGQAVIPAEELHARCWQGGTKIIDERGLEAINLDTLRRSGVLSFKRRGGRPGGGGGASVVIVPLNETVCLVTGGGD